MPQRTLTCQLGNPLPGVSRLISPRTDDIPCPQPSHDTHTPTVEIEHSNDYSAGRVALVRGACQEVSHTKSRRSGPRRWRRAVRWLIAAGHHPRASATTLRIAEDLADRMDYSTGHARYCLDEMAARLGVGRATIARHIAYLRELGALAWVQHGTRTNIRAAMGLKGYAATATVYAAVIPPVFDHAMGHTIVGAGYSARIVIDQRGTAKPVDNSPVDNPASEALETPSLTCVEEEGKLKVEGGNNYTSQARRDHAPSPTSKSNNNRSSSQGTGRHALQVAEDIRITRLVRALVNWTQTEGLRRLAFSLRPLIDRGLDSYGIAEYLHGMCSGMRWKPKNPAAYISTTLADRDNHEARQAVAALRYELENPATGAFTATHTQQQSVMDALDAGLALLHRNAAANGWTELAQQAAAHQTAHTNADAAADMAAFLGSPA